MISPLITIDQETSASDAIIVMRSKHIRRLVVTKKVTDNDGVSRDEVNGIVTLMSLTGHIPSNSIDLAEVEVPGDIVEKENMKIVCPYCQSKFENKTEMSKHIDRVHIRSGSLEGDLRHW